MQPESNPNDANDLQNFIVTLLQKWKWIVLVAVLFGAIAFSIGKLQTPIYKASSSVYINQEDLGLSINPILLIRSDYVRQRTAKPLDYPPDQLPCIYDQNGKYQAGSINITLAARDKNAYTITLNCEDPQNALIVANAWAEASILEVQESLLLYQQEETTALNDMRLAEQALIDYLDTNGLERWSFINLSLFTGVEFKEGINIFVDQDDSVTTAQDLPIEELPTINPEQRYEIEQLMHAQIAAAKRYQYASDKSIETTFTYATNPPKVLTYASAPTINDNSRIAVNTLIGCVTGIVSAIFWIYSKQWWQNNNINQQITGNR